MFLHYKVIFLFQWEWRLNKSFSYLFCQVPCLIFLAWRHVDVSETWNVRLENKFKILNFFIHWVPKVFVYSLF